MAEWWAQSSTPAPGTLSPGRMLAVVMCCPACAAVAVVRESQRKGAPVARWRCQQCGATWKEPAAVGRRAVVP